MACHPLRSDLTDAQWAAVQPLIPPPAPGGRKREVNLREVLNAIRYLQTTNCGWRGLPSSFPHRSTVRHYYDAWRENGTWQRIQAALGSTANAADSSKKSNDENPPPPQQQAFETH